MSHGLSRRELPFALATWASLLLASPRARGDLPERHPFVEALLTESTTDIDARDPGELELEMNAARAASRTDGAGATLTSLEVEWRMFQELGLRLEPSYSRVTDGGSSTAADAFGLAGALAFGIWHDWLRQLHLQGELLARTPESANARVFEPDETELPLAADLLAAVRAGRWTLRTTVGAEAGGAFAHAPLHTDAALLTGLISDERFGFVGLEARADWAREAPFVLAPEIVADASALDLPIRFGVALPINVGAGPTHASYGLFAHVAWIVGED